MKLIGLCGLKGAGKDTSADYFIKHIDSEKYFCCKMSYANTLKDAVCSIFGYDRNMIAGTTVESRQWREQKDEFWSEKIGYDITPRQIMQKLGTDLLRNQFYKNIWIDSLMINCQKIQKQSEKECIFFITDCRFPNEIDIITESNGKIIEVYREFPIDMSKISDLHESEISFIGVAKNPIKIINDGTLNDLENMCISIIPELEI